MGKHRQQHRRRLTPALGIACHVASGRALANYLLRAMGQAEWGGGY